MNPNRFTTRRDFLKASLAVGSMMTAGAALSACNSATTTTTQGNITLKHWDWYVTQGPWMDNEISLFHKANPNITIKRTVTVSDKYANQFSLADRSNTIPDTFMLVPGWTVAFEDQVNKYKWLLPISDFSDYQQFVGTFPNASLNFVTGSNISRTTHKTYSAPFEGPSPNIELWINTKVFRDAGLADSSGQVQVPQTMDEVLSAARAIKQKSGGKVYGYGFGGKLPYQDIWLMDLVTPLSSNGSTGGFNQRTGQYDFYDNPVYHQAIDWFKTMKSEGHILPQSASVDDEQIRFLFAQNKFGMLLGGIWVIAGWQQTNPDFKDYTMDHSPFINTTTAKGAYYTGPGGTNFGISAKTKYKDAAWKWLKWLYSKDAGERWVKAGNGTSIFPDTLKDEYAQNDAQKNYFKLCRTMVKVSPQRDLRNPDTSKVQEAGVTPAESDIVRGVFTGQISDYVGALKTLQDKKNTNLATAIKQAQANGAKVSLDDYKFPDWDPTQDYITKPNS